MARAVKMLVATLVVAAVSAGIAAAGGNGSQKFDLLGPNGDAFCDGSGVVAGAPGGFGFAVIKAPSNDTVAATVSVKGLTANATYNVLLIQGDGDCFTSDTTLTTNGQGNGNARVSEASTSTTAFVAVCLGGISGSCNSASESYVTATYNH